MSRKKTPKRSLAAVVAEMDSAIHAGAQEHGERVRVMRDKSLAHLVGRVQTMAVAPDDQVLAMQLGRAAADVILRDRVDEAIRLLGQSAGSSLIGAVSLARNAKGAARERAAGDLAYHYQAALVLSRSRKKGVHKPDAKPTIGPCTPPMNLAAIRSILNPGRQGNNMRGRDISRDLAAIGGKLHGKKGSWTVEYGSITVPRKRDAFASVAD